ncbi:Hypothetical predicted protein [Paramuricea clavata]|uniref:Uncharacterized protein n=1 Tax=Paramuricea clavata TaxID=317549 RepID=A0A7D9LMI9_PARCT|nr:Hypothetical predicted protein [Paramuricea clavata]
MADSNKIQEEIEQDQKTLKEITKDDDSSKKKKCRKPDHWTGSVADQKELFLHILAELTTKQLRAENNNCMDFETYNKKHRQLISSNWQKAIGFFHRIVHGEWGVEPKPDKAGIDDKSIISDDEIASTLWKITILDMRPSGEEKPYGGVYIFMANAVCFYVKMVEVE